LLCQRRRLTRSTLALVSIVDMVYLLLLLILGFWLVPVCQMLRTTFCKKKSLEKAINIWYWTRIQRQLLLIPLYPIRYMQACCPSWPGSQACNHGLHLCLVWTFPPQWLMRLRCYFSRTGVRYEFMDFYQKMIEFYLKKQPTTLRNLLSGIKSLIGISLVSLFWVSSNRVIDCCFDWFWLRYIWSME